MTDSDQQVNPKHADPEEPNANKNVSQAQGQEVAPSQEGVSTENLVYTEQEGGLRKYANQEPVKTEDQPAEDDA